LDDDYPELVYRLFAAAAAMLVAAMIVAKLGASHRLNLHAESTGLCRQRKRCLAMT